MVLLTELAVASNPKTKKTREHFESPGLVKVLDGKLNAQPPFHEF
jgi:hypothetical protein